MRRDAFIDGAYRYWLLRDWSGIGVNRALGPLPERFGVLWVMLNPSTADAEVDDPTIRKCSGFTKRLGHESFAVVNLFAYRATDPRELKVPSDGSWPVPGSWARHIIGPKNDSTIEALAPRASLIICAWGAFDGLNLSVRAAQVVELVRPSLTATWALGLTKAGAPRHPLMMPYYAATELKPWPPESRTFSQYTPRAAR